MSAEKIHEVLREMTDVYYDELPEKFATYCVLTSQVTQEVLRHFDIASYLIPCQMWCATRSRNYVIGYQGADARLGKWDGHIVCGTKDFLIDAAVSHFAVEFAIPVPRIVIAKRFDISSHTMARVDLADDNRLWWQDAPTVAGRYPTPEDLTLVKRLASGIIGRIEDNRRPTVVTAVAVGGAGATSLASTFQSP